MDINTANMSILFQAMSLRFKKAFEAKVERGYEPFTMVVPMGTRTLVMPFMEQITGMREWIGPRLKNHVRTDKLTFTTRKFELTQGIPRDDVEDDQYQMYGVLFEQMGVQAANLPLDLVGELLNKASSQKWIDGKNFFATDRKYGDGKNASNISNTCTSALSEESLKAAYDTMTEYKGHGGRSLHVRPTHLVHGTSLRWKAKELLKNPNVMVEGTAGAVTLTNPVQNLVEDLELPEIDGNKWFLVAANGPYKPVCYFSRRKPDHIVRKDKPTDDNVFDTDEYVYGCDARAEAAFVLPHLIYFGNPA